MQLLMIQMATLWHCETSRQIISRHVHSVKPLCNDGCDCVCMFNGVTHNWSVSRCVLSFHLSVGALCMCFYTFIMRLCVHQCIYSTETKQDVTGAIWLLQKWQRDGSSHTSVSHTVLHGCTNRHANPRVQTIMSVMCLYKLAWQMVVHSLMTSSWQASSRSLTWPVQWHEWFILKRNLDNITCLFAMKSSWRLLESCDTPKQSSF